MVDFDDFFTFHKLKPQSQRSWDVKCKSKQQFQNPLFVFKQKQYKDNIIIEELSCLHKYTLILKLHPSNKKQYKGLNTCIVL